MPGKLFKVKLNIEIVEMPHWGGKMRQLQEEDMHNCLL